jgi:transcriptional regulator with XRE-family HTH domain
MSSKETPISPNRVDVLLANKFFRARMEAGLGVSETAASLCVTERMYAIMESGGNRISPKMVFIMSVLTKRPIKWFYNDRREEEDAKESNTKLAGRACDDRLGLKPPAGIEALLKRFRDSQI